MSIGFCLKLKGLFLGLINPVRDLEAGYNPIKSIAVSGVNLPCDIS